MAEPHEKLTEVVPVRMEDTMKRFATRRADHLNLDSPAAYVRHLIASDMRSAEHEFNVLAEALGVQVSIENKDNG
jgi:hypothetical protein